MSRNKKEHHYAILYENERRTQYTIFVSTDLDALAQVYAKILLFESMFNTFPNDSCRVVLTEDFNYDPDCGSFDMSHVVNYKWEPFVEEIQREFGGRIKRPVKTAEEN